MRGSAPLAALPWLFCVHVAACDRATLPEPARERSVRVERTVFLMGTLATFVTDAAHREAGLVRLERMVRVVEATEAELSTWRDESVLSAVNRQRVGEPLPVPPAVCGLLGRLADWREATGGAFDPAVGSLIDVWQLRGAGRRPAAAEVEAALAASGLGHLTIDPDPCSITRRAAVTLDAGGFGKGEALERVRDAERARPGPWLIDFGGQVAVSGAGTDGGWPVAIAHPVRRDTPVLDLLVATGSLATTGGSERDPILEDGSRIGHVVDPHTGRTVARPASVSVWHEDAFVADVLSTALYVMGADQGLAWAAERDIAACFITAAPGARDVTFRTTSAFRERFGLAPPA